MAEGIEGSLGELPVLARKARRVEERKAKRRAPATRKARARKTPAPRQPTS